MPVSLATVWKFTQTCPDIVVDLVFSFQTKLCLSLTGYRPKMWVTSKINPHNVCLQLLNGTVTINQSLIGGLLLGNILSWVDFLKKYPLPLVHLLEYKFWKKTFQIPLLISRLFRISTLNGPPFSYNVERKPLLTHLILNFPNKKCEIQRACEVCDRGEAQKGILRWREN